uniref:Ig-like domain-containing protein n=1 Tax=Equus caballus TaxID=9796 RepID=A0A9L0T6S5_HORSE
MAWAPFFLIILAHCTGESWSEVVLTQPRSVSESLGQKATMSCTRSSGNIGSSYVYWYQQRPGSAPTTMIYDDDERLSGVPDGFSGSIDSSSNAAYPTLSGLQPEDEADNYCQSYDSSYKHTVLQTCGEVRSKLPRASPCCGCSFLFPPRVFFLRLYVYEALCFLSKLPPHVQMDDFLVPFHRFMEVTVANRVSEPQRYCPCGWITPCAGSCSAHCRRFRNVFGLSTSDLLPVKS